jgi:hypothetical protein
MQGLDCAINAIGRAKCEKMHAARLVKVATREKAAGKTLDHIAKAPYLKGID